MSRPRLLVCGSEGSGQAALGAALLHALEGLPIHSIGLPSLLADPGMRFSRYLRCALWLWLVCCPFAVALRT